MTLFVLLVLLTFWQAVRKHRQMRRTGALGAPQTHGLNLVVPRLGRRSTGSDYY